MSSPEAKAVTPDDQRSVSDGDLDSEKKRRRIRRRRGNRGRFRPYELGEPESEQGTSTGERKRLRNRKDMPMAPNNTTQFLLEDMETRAEVERETEIEVNAEERRRIRSISVSSELMLDDDAASDSFSDAEHREFENEFEEFTRERISHLSKNEMTNEIIDMEKTAEVFHDNLLRVNRENERLKRLLKDNGIVVGEGTNTSPQPVA